MDTRIEQIVSEFCEGNRLLEKKTEARGKCLITSIELEKKLAEAGISVEFVRVDAINYLSREHWAILVDNSTVIDATARQFDEGAAFPLIQDLESWLDDCVEWLEDDLDYEVYVYWKDESPRESGWWIP